MEINIHYSWRENAQTLCTNAYFFCSDIEIKFAMVVF